MRIDRHRATYGGFEPRVRLNNYSMKPGEDREFFRWCSVKSDKMKDFPDVDGPGRPFEVAWIDLSHKDANFVVEVGANKTERCRPLRVSVVGCLMGFVRYGSQPAPASLVRAVKEGRTHFGVHTFAVPPNQSIKISGI